MPSYVNFKSLVKTYFTESESVCENESVCFADNPEALDSLAENELYVSLECEKTRYQTALKHGVTWNEQFTVYLVSPVTAALNIKVSNKTSSRPALGL